MLVSDTSTLIALVKKSPIGEEAYRTMGMEPLAITSITAYEFLNNVKESEIEERERIVSNLKVFALDQESAILSSRLSNELRKTGKTVPELDLFIAAICIRNNLPLITLDSDFKRIPNLKVIVVK